MPLRKKAPSIKTRTLKGKDFAYTYLRAKQIHLGPVGSPDTFQRFQAVLDAFHQGTEYINPKKESQELGFSVSELAARWIDVQARRVQQDELSSTQHHAQRAAMKDLVHDVSHALVEVSDFRPYMLEDIANRISQATSPKSGKPYARSEVRRRCALIRQAFKWGVGRDLVPAEVWSSLLRKVGMPAGAPPANPSLPGLDTVPALDQLASTRSKYPTRLEHSRSSRKHQMQEKQLEKLES